MSAAADAVAGGADGDGAAGEGAEGVGKPGEAEALREGGGETSAAEWVAAEPTAFLARSCGDEEEATVSTGGSFAAETGVGMKEEVFEGSEALAAGVEGPEGGLAEDGVVVEAGEGAAGAAVVCLLSRSI